MYQFHSLNLTNYLLWHDVEFTFEPGITLVSGGNRSGKSLLFSPLRPMFYNSDEIPRAGRATLNFSTPKHTYDLTLFNQGKKTNRWSLTVDGKEQKTERISDARTLIERYFTANIQESLFETTIHVDGLGRHPLTTGKPSTRLDWVHETLAYASVLDTYVEKLNRQIESTKKDSIKHGILKDQLLSLQVPDKPAAISELRDELAQTVEAIKTNETKLRNLKEAARVKKTSDVSSPRVPLRVLEKQLRKEEETYNELVRLRRQYDANKAGRKLVKTLQSKLEKAKEKYKAACIKAKAPIRNPEKVVTKDILKILKDDKDRLRNAERNNEIYEDQTETRRLLKEYKHLEWDDSDDDLKKQRKKLEKRISIKRLTLSAIESGQETCEVCGSSIKSHGDASVIQADIQKIERSLDKIELKLKLSKAYTVKLVDWIDVDKLQRRIDLAEAVINTAKKYCEILDQLTGVRDEMPGSVSFDEDTFQKSKKRIDSLNQQVMDAQVYEKTQKELKRLESNPYVSLSRKQLKLRIEKIEDYLSKLYTKQKKLNDAVIQNETARALYRKYKEEKAELEQSLEDVRTAAKDYRLLMVMKKALGREGFRTQRLESTLELFVDNLNELAPLILKEPFKFEIDVGKRRCDLIVHRNGKSGSGFSLSGSERRCWQMLAALGMLRLLPSNRRTDTIILDELEANLDDDSRWRFAKDFLPELQKTVPNIVVVTPLSKKVFPVDTTREFTVSKRNGQSILKQEK